jgi:hypothetical protein
MGAERKCAKPLEVGLVPIENKFGTTIWRKPE